MQRARIVVAVALLPVTSGLVAHWEGMEFVPYRDIVGVWTVCNGITGPAVIPGKVYTRQECRDLLNGALVEHARGLARCLTVAADVPQPTLTAWISWTYNIGVGAACSSTLVRLANAGQFEAACMQLLRWDKAGGKVVDGLVNRRRAELAWCLHGLGIGPAPRVMA